MLILVVAVNVACHEWYRHWWMVVVDTVCCQYISCCLVDPGGGCCRCICGRAETRFVWFLVLVGSTVPGDSHRQLIPATAHALLCCLGVDRHPPTSTFMAV